MKLVIVDDSGDLRSLLRKGLEPFKGIEITGEAANVKDGIDLLEARKPDVAILDFQLPDGTAIDILNRMETNSASPVFIIFTSHSGAYYRQACLNAGATYFFNKACEFEELIALIAEMSKQGE